MTLLRQLAEVSPESRVIILTAHGTVADAGEATRLGAADFLLKPFSPDELRTLVARVLDRERLDAAQARDDARHIELARRPVVAADTLRSRPSLVPRPLGTTTMNASERDGLIAVLKARFEKNMRRHEGIAWDAVQARLERNPAALTSLRAMEASGGEPDVIGQGKTGQVIFCDCSAESPTGRRSLCYDREALEARKENKPTGSAAEMAAEMGVELLTEQQYRELQELGEFDTKTSSWVVTPRDVRSLGGALFCDRRYGKVFVYHNGAQSYYAARGFRGRLSV